MARTRSEIRSPIGYSTIAEARPVRSPKQSARLAAQLYSPPLTWIWHWVAFRNGTAPGSKRCTSAPSARKSSAPSGRICRAFGMISASLYRRELRKILQRICICDLGWLKSVRGNAGGGDCESTGCCLANERDAHLLGQVGGLPACFQLPCIRRWSGVETSLRTRPSAAPSGSLSLSSDAKLRLRRGRC